MKFSEHWLRTFVDPALDTQALAEALTMAGLEVESVTPAAPPFTRVVVGEVLAVEKHPNADRLALCHVNCGLERVLQIVCGAPNVVPGIRVPCALEGAELPGIAIGRTKVRGVESEGMLCSARELGLASEAQGLLALPADAPVGADLRRYLDLDDFLFTLKLTPNRGDCLSVLGIARELAALTGSELSLPETGPVAASVSDSLAVGVEAPEACPLYCGRVVRGIERSARTPEWIKRRLERSASRAVLDPVVDVTNYVMLELGQPLHAFDLARIAGGIRVRFAREGERLALLNGSEIALAPDLLVIADERRVLALGGIMGGRESAVAESTRDIFLESAFFSPEAVAGRSRRLGFATDASYRFERGVDFAATRLALERATRLILEVCGGEAGPVVEARSAPPKREPIRLRPERVGRVLGIDLGPTRIRELLSRLKLNFTEEGETFLVTPPSYRFDLALEEDLIEELARLHGYQRIPATRPRAWLAMLPQPEARMSVDALRAILVDRDYQEVINYAFVDPAWEAELCGNGQPVKLANPIASQMAVMRSSLLPGLVENLRFNLNRKQTRVRLFEVGRCFLRKDGGYAQPERLAGLAYGPSWPEQWGAGARGVDFFDVKADVEALFRPRPVTTEPALHPAFHPGRSARIWVEREAAGWIGELNPAWQQKYELPQPAVLFELELPVLASIPVPVAREVSKFPPVRRDIAVVVDEKVDAESLLAALRAHCPSTVTEIALFDLYRGKGLDHGKKSLAFRVLLQDTQKTLTDPEVDAAITRLVRVLEHEFQAKLRS